MQQLPKNWHVKDSAEEVAETARDLILQAAKEAIEKNGTFKIVLAGGTTPENVYQLLVKETCDWKNWCFYLGDERCLPKNNSERNSQMLEKTLFDQIDITKENMNFMHSERGGKEAAKAYEVIVKAALPFDMVLLGMGEDGHTASLFPDHVHLESELVHAVYKAPKPPPERVSLSQKALSQNHNLLIMVTGASKQESVKKWKEGEKLPVSTIKSQGKIHILLDKAAYAL